MSVAHDALVVFTFLIVAYLVLWHASQLAMTPFSAFVLWRHQRRQRARVRRLSDRVAVPPPVSIVVPAFNEELTIVESTKALLALDYRPREIVIVSDGSTDGTLPLLQRTFQLVPAPFAFVQPLSAERVRAVYRSVSEPDLVVVDKDNGGCKADAANAGINVASGVLVLVIDADTILDTDALSRAVTPFLEDPATVAVGAHVGIANGCRIERGRITEVSLPHSWLARFQVVEYMHAFLLFRLACASQNTVVLISGAFGLFRRDAVIAVGGFDRTSIGEDMDLTIRLQRYFRERGEPARITFDPYPLCWTQVPEDWRSLQSQRCRWRRGLLQALWRHRGMIGRPRFGTVGLGALPYTAFFEGLGPLLEGGGLLVTLLAAVFGYLNWKFFGTLLIVSVSLGAGVTLLTVLMSDVVMRRYARGPDLAILVAVAILESFGYRQMQSVWGWLGTVQALSGTSGWGSMKRRPFRT